MVLWCNVIMKLNFCTGEQVCSAWVCVSVCFWDYLWEVHESQWHHQQLEEGPAGKEPYQ